MRKTWHYDSTLECWMIPDGDADLIFKTEEAAAEYQKKYEQIFGTGGEE